MAFLRTIFSAKRSLPILFALLAAAVASAQSDPGAQSILRLSAQALQNNPNLPYNPYVVIVKFAPSARTSDRALSRAHIGGIKIADVQTVPGLEIVSTQVDPRLAVAQLRSMPGVEYAELDYTVKANVLPNDPSLGSLWGLHNTGQSGGVADADIDAPEAWDIFTGNPNTVVAVIDTGIQRSHPDLAANIWTNPGEIAGNGIDDDSNGYVDDVNGWDFANNDNDSTDDNGHGTHCAGTIGGVGNNGVGVVGVNWRVKLVGLKFLAANGSGSTSRAIMAVDYCRRNGIKISNNSWGGGGYSQALYDSINTARTAIGHLFVAAAGNAGTNNDTTPFYPASYTLDNVISVASIDRTDVRSNFSNYGLTSVDLGAPGSSIFSTYPGSAYATMSGTSMATPHVAGAVALLWGYVPNWTYLQVRSSILGTVRVTAAMNGVTATGGVLNVRNALVSAQGSGNTAPVTTITAPVNGLSVTQGTSVTFTGTASDTQDGNITGSLTWTSSINGAIGSGGSFATSTLSVGTHTITAKATDSGGLTGSATRTVTVTATSKIPAPPTNLVIVKVGSAARVSWKDNSSNETGFRVQRQKLVAGTWTNTTTYTVGANVTLFSNTPGRGTFRYRVQAYNAFGSSGYAGYLNVTF
jgi:large repetitive protein